MTAYDSQLITFEYILFATKSPTCLFTIGK